MLDREARDPTDRRIRERTAGTRHDAAEAGGLAIGEDVQAVDADMDHEVELATFDLGVAVGRATADNAKVLLNTSPVATSTSS